MPTHSPTPQTITPEKPPQFPCWLWRVPTFRPEMSEWNHLTKEDWVFFGIRIESEYTHWLPDSPTAPTCLPGEGEHPAVEELRADHAEMDASQRRDMNADRALSAHLAMEDNRSPTADTGTGTPGLSKTRLRKENRLLRTRAEAAEALLRTYYGAGGESANPTHGVTVEHVEPAPEFRPDALKHFNAVAAALARPTPPDEQWADLTNAREATRIIVEAWIADKDREEATHDIESVVLSALRHAPKTP